MPILFTTLVILAVSAPVPFPAPARPQTQENQPTAAYYFLLGRHLEEQGRIEEAIAAHRQAIALDPDSAELRAELAGLFARQDRAREAVDMAREALARDRENGEANHVLGSVLAAAAAQQRPIHPGENPSTYAAEAVTALERARAQNAGDLGLDLTLARLYLAQHQAAKAVPLLRGIVDEQPGYAEGHLLLAQAQEESGALSDAIRTLEAATGDRPSFRASVQLASLYERQGRWLDAASAWGRALASNPDNSQVLARRAAALINGGKAAEARDLLAPSAAAADADPGLQYMFGQAQRQAGDLKGAEATARALRTAHPGDPRGTYLLTQVYMAADRFQEVLGVLQPEIERLRAAGAEGRDQLPLMLSSQGLALQELHRSDEAIAALKEAVQLAPDDTSFRYQLGAIQDRAGRRDEAERTFRDLLAKDPLDANALNYIGYMLAEHGTRLDEAVDLIQRALKIEPGNPSFLDSLGWAYVQQGHLDLADQPLTDAASRLPNNSVVQDHLGDLRMRQKRPADAIAAWQKALAGDGDSIDRAAIEKKIAAARAAR
ncbi:MAG TPA: tetratricopeptide repeat protein [Vicinamibacterales bacterium]|nr:tetratricopeptide repeat protein [Vicinamibacterales bacterium]